MRLARIDTPDGPRTGEYDDGTVTVDGEAYVVGEDAALLPPSEPSALYCVGRNYPGYLEEHGFERPDSMRFFIKPPASALAPDRPIPYPNFTDELTYGGELAAVIDERCKRVSPDEAGGVIRGYTTMNDVDAKDQPRVGMRKAFDAAGPFGPCLATDIDPMGLDMETRIDGEIRQDSNTDRMFFHPHEVVAFFAERFTLRPGDLVAFGSPANPGLIEPGDGIEITYEGIGTLRNTVGERESA